MLSLDFIRAEFARYLTENTTTRWGLDAALAHVTQLAYQQGAEDACKNNVAPCAIDLLTRNHLLTEEQS